MIDLDLLRRDRDQLWAEAATLETRGESITLDESLWGDARTQQEMRRAREPWEDILSHIPTSVQLGVSDGNSDPPRHQIVYSEGDYERVASSDLITYVLRVPIHQQNRGHSMRLAVIMGRLGWEKERSTTGERQRGYFRDRNSISM
jgi:hypothetical protein